MNQKYFHHRRSPIYRNIKKSKQYNLNHLLYQKYASSQNYYYTKEINEIIHSNRSHAVIRYNDQQTLDEQAEYFKRMYARSEFKSKILLLSEFYKYHKDLPRWAIQYKLLKILNYYYDKIRKLNYYQVQKIIEQENNLNPNQPKKGIVGDRPIESRTSSSKSYSSEESKHQPVENILKDLEKEPSFEIQQIISMMENKQTKKPFQKPLPLKLEDICEQSKNEPKMPLSARYKSFNQQIIDQLQLRKKHSAEKKPQNNFFSRKPSVRQLEMKVLQGLKELKKEEKKPFNILAPHKSIGNLTKSVVKTPRQILTPKQGLGRFGFEQMNSVTSNKGGLFDFSNGNGKLNLKLDLQKLMKRVKTPTESKTERKKEKINLIKNLTPKSGCNTGRIVFGKKVNQ